MGERPALTHLPRTLSHPLEKQFCDSSLLNCVTSTVLSSVLELGTQQGANRTCPPGATISGR